MDDRQFDSLARSLAAGQSRRRVLKAMLGLIGAVSAGVALPPHADAARRGYSGPLTPGGPEGSTCGEQLFDCSTLRDNIPQCGDPDVTLYCCPGISGRLRWTVAIC